MRPFLWMSQRFGGKIGSYDKIENHGGHGDAAQNINAFSPPLQGEG